MVRLRRIDNNAGGFHKFCRQSLRLEGVIVVGLFKVRLLQTNRAGKISPANICPSEARAVEDGALEVHAIQVDLVENGVL